MVQLLQKQLPPLILYTTHSKKGPPSNKKKELVFRTKVFAKPDPFYFQLSMLISLFCKERNILNKLSNFLNSAYHL